MCVSARRALASCRMHTVMEQGREGKGSGRRRRWNAAWWRGSCTQAQGLRRSLMPTLVGRSCPLGCLFPLLYCIRLSLSLSVCIFQCALPLMQVRVGFVSAVHPWKILGGGTHASFTILLKRFVFCCPFSPFSLPSFYLWGISLACFILSHFLLLSYSPQMAACAAPSDGRSRMY